MGTEEGRERQNPVRRVTGGGGPVGEKQEETEGYLRVALARKEKAGGGGSVASGRPAAALSTAAALLWLGAAVEGSGRTSEPRGARPRGRLGSREGGGWGSPVS